MIWSLVMVRNQWLTCYVENFLPQNCNISSVLSIFKYNPGKTNNKFITFWSFLSICNDIIPTSSKRRRRFIVYGLVARYGPQTSRKGLNNDAEGIGDYFRGILFLGFLRTRGTENKPRKKKQRDRDRERERERGRSRWNAAQRFKSGTTSLNSRTPLEDHQWSSLSREEERESSNQG